MAEIRENTKGAAWVGHYKGIALGEILLFITKISAQLLCKDSN